MTASARSGSASARRPLLIGAAILAGVAILGLLTIALFPKGRVQAVIVSGAERSFGVAPAIESIHATLFPLGVELRGIRIANPAGADYPPLVQLAEADVSVRFLPLLRGRVEFARARLDSLRLVLVKGPEGKILMPPQRGEPPSGAPGAAGHGWRPAILLSGAEIRNATLRILDPATGAEQSIGLLENHLSFRLSDRGRRIETEGRLTASDIRTPELIRSGFRDGFPGLALEYDLTFLPEQGEAEIRRLNIHAQALSVDLAGTASGIPADPTIALRIDTPQIELADLLSLLPPEVAVRTRGLQGSGPLSLAGEATIAPPDPPVYRLTLTLSGLSARHPEVSEGLDDLRGILEITERSTSIQGFSFLLAGRRVSLEGSIANYRSPEVDLALDGEVDLAAVSRAKLLPPGAEAAGEVTVHLTAAGAVKQPENLELGGHLAMSGITFTAPAKAGAAPVAVRGGTGRARFERNAMILESFRCVVNDAPLELAGRLEDPTGARLVSLDVRARRLDLDRFLPPAPPPGAEGGGEPSPPPSAVALLPPIPDATIEITARADTLTTMGHLMTGVRLKSRVVRGQGGATLSMAHGAFKGVDIYLADSELTLDKVEREGRVVPALRGTVNADSATAYRRLLLTRAEGDVLITSDGRIEVTGVRAAAHGGEVKGDVEVLVKGARQVDVRWRTDATDLDANDFLSRFTPAKDVLHGKLSLHGDWAASGTTAEAIARTLSANGDFATADGRLENVAVLERLSALIGVEELGHPSFHSLAGAFEVKDGRLHTRALGLEGRDGVWNISGSVGFDGTLDCKVALALPAAFASRVRAPAGFAQLLADEEGRILFDFDVSGSARDPVVKVDATKTAARAKGKVGSILEEAIKKNDGKKLLEDLLKKKKP